MSQDTAGMTMLTAVTQTIADVDGPISPRIGAGALLAMSGILQERRRPISMATLEAIMAVVVALRDDISG